MASTTTIPEKTYVTIQYRADSSAEGKLGFLSPYTKDSAFQKHKDTQDKWAYGYGVTVKINEDDDVTVSGKGNAGRNGEWDAAALFMTNCYPRILKNELTEGFEVAKSVRRCGWNGSGNVLWRIADPRGFELEISSENFARVLDCTTIINGVIQGKCVWGRDGSKNILLPEASDVYQEAVKRTSKVNSNISLKDVQVGDTVELLSKDGEDLGGQYLGKYFFMQYGQAPTDRNDRLYGRYTDGIYRFNFKQVERYLFRADDKYFVLSSPKVTAIVSKIETPLDKTVIAQEATDYRDNTHDIKGIDSVVLVSPTKIKLNTVTSKLVPFEYVGGNWPVTNKYYTEAIICEMNGKYYLAKRKEKSGPYPRETEPKLQECNVTLDGNSIEPKYTVASGGSGYWGRYTSYEEVLSPDFDLNTVKKYKIEVTANGITSKIYNLGIY